MIIIIMIILDALDTFFKGLVQGLQDLEIWGQVETILTRAILQSARIMRTVLETLGDLLSLKLH